MRLKIYWTSIEYKYNKASDKFGKLSGGFVYGFVKAIDEKEALTKFKNELKHHNIDVKVVEFISLYDIATQWETQELVNRFNKLYTETLSSNKVLFDEFYAYEKKE